MFEQLVERGGRGCRNTPREIYWTGSRLPDAPYCIERGLSAVQRSPWSRAVATLAVAPLRPFPYSDQ
jgi:hypothetical protein